MFDPKSDSAFKSQLDFKSNFEKINFGLVMVLAASVMLSACGSSRLKARQEQRDKAVAATGLYCEWIDGERHTDFDVEVNLQMAKRCDSSKPFSLVPFKNNSDRNGIMYCCATPDSQSAGANSYAPTPRRAAGPAVRRVSPAAPAASSAPAPAQAPAAAVNSGEAPDLSQDQIVEDK